MPLDPDATLVERHLHTFGRTTEDSPLFERLRTIELDLHAQRGRLAALGSSRAEALSHAHRLRQQVSAFLDEPGGTLPQAVRDWSPRNARDAESSLQEVLARGELLWGRAYETLDFADRLTHARDRLGHLAERYRESVPDCWARSCGHLAARLERVRTRREVDPLLDEMDRAEKRLARRLEALERLEVELLKPGRLDLGVEDRHWLSNVPDLEVRVRRLLGLAEEHGRTRVASATASVQAVADEQLGLPSPDPSDTSRAEGSSSSTESALDRWEGLRRINGWGASNLRA